MKKSVKVMSLLLSTLILAGCGAAPAGSPSSASLKAEEKDPSVEMKTAEKTEQALAEIAKLGQAPGDDYRVWYEIFVYSYCDSNGDGIGDLQGVISKLDELQKLGVGGIWLMPLHPSNSYHKYDVLDYYSIDPAYGTKDDFDALVKECDKRGIKIIMDLVLNHTGNEHEWFRQAAQYLASLPEGAQPDPKECPYVEYYNFVNAEECPAGYHPVSNASGWYYEGHFGPHMPDVNFASERLRGELQKIMAFWLEQGIAGFRLDAVKEYYSDQTDKNVEVLHWIQQTATTLKPDCYLVGEVWEGFDTLSNYYKSGINSLFDFPFGNNNGKITKVLQGAGNPSVVSTYAQALEKADTAYREKNPDYMDSPFLSNHDVGRIAGFVGRDPQKMKLAGAMNLFMSGSAFLYYGEELGMVSGAVDDPSYRAPMCWNEARDHGTTQPPPGCTLPEEYPLGSLEVQRGDDSSIYNYYRMAIAIRNGLPAVSHGRPAVETALNQGCVSAVRKTWDGQACIILMNIDEKAAEVDLSDYTAWRLAAGLSANEDEVTRNGDTLRLPAYGTAILLDENEAHT